MREFLPEVDTWRAAGDRVAIATVVKVEGSAPRPVGATMAVSASGELAGSVSGGCVETAVFDEAQGVLTDGTPRLIRYGITDEMAWDVGLACGGTIEVYIEALDGDVEGARGEGQCPIGGCAGARTRGGPQNGNDGP